MYCFGVSGSRHRFYKFLSSLLPLRTQCVHEWQGDAATELFLSGHWQCLRSPLSRGLSVPQSRSSIPCQPVRMAPGDFQAQRPRPPRQQLFLLPLPCTVLPPYASKLLSVCVAARKLRQVSCAVFGPSFLRGVQYSEGCSCAPQVQDMR